MQSEKNSTAQLALNYGPRKKGLSHYLRRDWQKYLMLLFPVALVFLFNYVPMYGILIAFKDYNFMKGVWASPWVGLDNFIHAFSLPRFSRVLRNTLVINLLSLVIYFPMPIMLAIIISEMKNSKIVRIVQTVSYLPHFLSTVIVGGIVYQLCAPRTGLFNQILVLLGLNEVPFLTNPTMWLFTYVISGVWEGVGWGSIIYIAAITGINPELFEAAIIDGANRLQRIWHITLPSIKSTIVLMLILKMGSIISIGFDRPFVFSNPLVADVSEVISLFVYYVGLGQGDYKLGTVVGLFQSVVGAVMVLIVNAISKALGEEGLW
jgi:putative aldouronate transport system permease protein